MTKAWVTRTPQSDHSQYQRLNGLPYTSVRGRAHPETPPPPLPWTAERESHGDQSERPICPARDQDAPMRVPDCRGNSTSIPGGGTFIPPASTEPPFAGTGNQRSAWRASVDCIADSCSSFVLPHLAVDRHIWLTAAFA
jgi:hypothetical protein